jgi:serine/threonine-protein kinase RsbW/stage II sporulation protein AB (anti-sigma F factor)
LTLAAVPESIRAIRTAIADVAVQAGASPATVAAIRLAVSEAVTNAVRHAYDEGSVSGEIRACARVEHDGEDLLVVAVSDDGPGLRPRPDSPGLGLGLPLIAQSARSMDIINGDPGATVCMRFALP